MNEHVKEISEKWEVLLCQKSKIVDGAEVSATTEVSGDTFSCEEPHKSEFFKKDCVICPREVSNQHSSIRQQFGGHDACVGL